MHLFEMINFDDCLKIFSTVFLTDIKNVRDETQL